MTSHTAHTKYKWPPYATEWNTPMKIICVRHCWQLSQFAHTSQLINLIEAKSEGLFYQVLSSQCVFISSCDLFWSHQHCGITAECGVDKSVNNSTAHVCAFCKTKSLCKNAKCDAYALVAQTVTIGKQRTTPKLDLKIQFLPTPTTLDQTPSVFQDFVQSLKEAVFKD